MGAGGRREASLELVERPRALEFVPLGVFAEDDLGSAAVAMPCSNGLSPVAATPRAHLPAAPRLEDRAGVIEVDLPDGVRVRVDAFVNERALRRVLLAMKAVS